MMAESLIRGLYHGRIEPDECITVKNEEYESFSRLEDIQSRKVKKLLSEESYKEVLQLAEIQTAMHGMMCEEHFYQGFKLGVCFLVESLGGSDSLLKDKPLFRNSAIFGYPPQRETEDEI